jgi:hypothetical protein
MLAFAGKSLSGAPAMAYFEGHDSIIWTSETIPQMTEGIGLLKTRFI